MDEKTWKKEYYDCPDSVRFIAIPDSRGRITIPASVRKKLGIKPSSILSLTVKSLKRRIKK